MICNLNERFNKERDKIKLNRNLRTKKFHQGNKNGIENFNSRIDQTEEIICQLEDTSFEIHMRKKRKKNKKE